VCALKAGQAEKAEVHTDVSGPKAFGNQVGEVKYLRRHAEESNSVV